MTLKIRDQAHYDSLVEYDHMGAELKRIALARIRAHHARQDRINIAVALVVIGLLAAIAAAPIVVLALEWYWGEI